MEPTEGKRPVPRLLLVDGSNLLFQMYFGMPGRIVNRAGEPVQGVLGFVGALGKMIARTKPTHVAVFFDGERENPRKALDEDYKANRPDYGAMEDNPFTQLPGIFRALDVMGIRWAETGCCETDDWMAGYARQSLDAEVVIASWDSDFFQLISDRVTVLRYRGDRTVCCDQDWLWEKFAIRPEQYPEFKALVGDRADNIPGVKGIGPKTAAALLEQFGSLEAMGKRLEQVARPRIREALEQNRERLEKNLALIRLEGGEELPFALSELACPPRRGNTRQVLEQAQVLP